MNSEDFIQRLGDRAKAKRNGSGFMACCPAHEDKTPSLSVNDGDKGGVVVNCFTGCRPEDICSAVGLKLADLMPEQPHRNGHAKEPIATYDYRDEQGKMLFQVRRYHPKEFLPYLPGAKTPGIKGARRVPYNLPEVLAAAAEGRPVYVCEGEKDADAVAGIGFASTCNPFGASKSLDKCKWEPGFNPHFKGAHVTIIADKDEPGRAHAQGVARNLQHHAASIKVIELPDRDGRPVKDAHDWIAAGGEAAELDELTQAAPVWAPGSNGEAGSGQEEASWQRYAQEWGVKRLLEPIDHGQSLLGDRYVERGGTMAVVAPSGLGKTVASVQMGALWSIGRPAFHIKPSGALRILVVQNEDSENDTKGALQGIVGNCGFSQSDVQLLNTNLKVVRLVALRGLAAAGAIRSMAIAWKADLVMVNPLMAYVPGRQGEETEVFVREHLQPIAVDLAVGIIAIHHTPKIGRQNGVGTGANEYERQYNSAGKAEVVNAFRGILNIMPVGSGVFLWTADKRGRKIGWVWDGKPTIERYFKHASEPDNPDLIWWTDATPEEAKQAAESGRYQDILKAIPEHGAEPVSRARIRDTAKQLLNIGKDRADEWLKLVIDDELAERIMVKNENGKNEAFFCRVKGVQEVWK